MNFLRLLVHQVEIVQVCFFSFTIGSIPNERYFKTCVCTWSMFHYKWSSTWRFV